MVVYSKRSEIERVQFPASFALIELIKKTRLTFEFSDSKTKFLTPSLLPFFFPLNFRVSDRSRIARVRFRFIHRSRDQQRTLISVLIYMRVSSESWLHSSKKEQKKKKEKITTIPRSSSTRIFNFVSLERELEKSLFHLRRD